MRFHPPLREVAPLVRAPGLGRAWHMLFVIVPLCLTLSATGTRSSSRPGRLPLVERPCAARADGEWLALLDRWRVLDNAAAGRVRATAADVVRRDLARVGWSPMLLVGPLDNGPDDG